MTATIEEKVLSDRVTRDECTEESKQARLALVGEESVGKPVTITRMATDQYEPNGGHSIVGVKGTLESIDQSDPNRLYYVRCDERPPGCSDRMVWAYDVRLGHDEVQPVTVLGPVDGPADAGDRVKVLRCLSGASDAFQAHAVGMLATVVNGTIDGPNLLLVVRLDEPFAADGEVLRECQIRSWAKVLQPGTTFAEAEAPAAESVAEVDPMEALREQVRQAEQRAARAESALETLKVDVGTIAMKKAKEHGWCSEVQRALEEVGIEPVMPETEYDVRVTLTATQTVTVQVTAASEDDAREKVEEDSDLAWNEVDRDDWSLESHDVDEVSES